MNDERDHLCFFPGHLRELPATLPGQNAVEICSISKVLNRCSNTKIAGLINGGSLVLHHGSPSMNQVKEHVHVSPVPCIREPDTFSIGNHHIDGSEMVPDLPADEHPFAISICKLRKTRSSFQGVLHHLVILLNGIVNPAGEHPIPDLIVTNSFDFCDPPDATLRNGAGLSGTILVHGVVLELLLERGRNSLQNLLHLLR